MPVGQVCSADGCRNAAAFTTRTKPAWCEGCLNGILSELAMDPLTAFPGKDNRWRTRCRVCSAECDYKLDYLLELRTRSEPPCRRCFWIQWTAHADLMSGSVCIVSEEQVAEHLASREFEPVERLADLPSGGWPVIARCLRCGIQGAHRIGDLSCPCRTNAKPSRPLAGKTRGAKSLFVDSGSPALAWWDPDRNSPALLATITDRARMKCAWVCPQCGHSFTASVGWMSQTPECPECDKRLMVKYHAERDRLATMPVAEVPVLLAAWDDHADPRTTMVGDFGLRRFRCAEGHKPRVHAGTYLSQGCPFCRAAAHAGAPRATLASELPEIAAQWHPKLNGKWTPETVGPDSKRTAHWQADCCGHVWSTPVRDRNKRERLRCPRCRTILDSLGWVDPGLAAEWDPSNPTTPWHVRPHGHTSFNPAWICSVDHTHQWEAAVSSRSNGSDCPDCKQVGKSRVELQHHDAAKVIFGKVRSGAFVRDDAFSTRKRWSVDILIEHDGEKVAVEYDGAYWHRSAAKIEVDRRKSLDLLAAGYRVVRLREDDLPSLAIDSPGYLELQVYSLAPKPTETVFRIAGWLAPVD